jgi:hypothetical protein
VNTNQDTKERLKAAIKLRQEGRRWLKAGKSARPPTWAAEFQLMGELINAAADDLMLNVPPCEIVSGEIVPAESERPDDKDD